MKNENDQWKISTYFHNNKMPKEGLQFVGLSVILTYFIFRMEKNEKKKRKEKKIKYITDDIAISSDSSDKFFWQRMFWWRKFWWRKFKKYSYSKVCFLKQIKKLLKYLFIISFYI